MRASSAPMSIANVRCQARKVCRRKRRDAQCASIWKCSTTLPSAVRRRVTAKRINLTDPASRWTAATREAAFYSYSTNYLIDLDHAVIVDAEATTSVRQAEVTAQRRMIERTQERFGIWPERLVADGPTGRPPTWPGWSRTRASSRTSPC